ncbi:hypothetical protein R1flu_015486 [Riccia fluitans]|uniref:Uncharacterized protein n=1 Tax=Riccia fluitans TaxID=41844 RepID=A0ABD1YJE9_9MARC
MWICHDPSPCCGWHCVWIELYNDYSLLPLHATALFKGKAKHLHKVAPSDEVLTMEKGKSWMLPGYRSIIYCAAMHARSGAGKLKLDTAGSSGANLRM